MTFLKRKIIFISAYLKIIKKMTKTLKYFISTYTINSASICCVCMCVSRKTRIEDRRVGGKNGAYK